MHSITCLREILGSYLTGSYYCKSSNVLENIDAHIVCVWLPLLCIHDLVQHIVAMIVTVSIS